MMPPPRYPSTGSPGVWGTAGPPIRRKPKPRGYTTADALEDTRRRARPVDGKAFGEDKGYGVYRGKYGQLTYKGSGPKPAASPQKDGASAPDSITSDGTGLGSELDAISKYNLARAEILKGIAGQIGSAYGTAGDAISGYGRGLSDGLRDTLTAQGEEAASRFGAATENLLPGSTAAIAPSYNPQAAEIGYGIGAFLPAESMAAQGAAFQGAAAFLPGAALQQGAYQLAAAQREASKAASSGTGAAKASSSLSKALGYLVDGSGQPILGKNGKPIKLPAGQLTPYQSAQLKLAQTKEARYIDSENFDRWATTQRLKFQSASQKLAVKKALAAGKQIDSSASRGLGYVVYKDGSVARGPNGKRIAFKSGASSTPATKAKAAYQKAVAFAMDDDLRGQAVEHPTRPGWYFAKPGAAGNDVARDASGKLITTNESKANRSGGYQYADALTILVERFGLTKSQARRALFTAGWKPPKKKTKKAGYREGENKTGAPRMGD